MTESEMEVRKANRCKSLGVVVGMLREQLPEAVPAVRVVGRWLWASFEVKPPSHVLHGLKVLGFSWNNKRGCWQHPCGVFFSLPARAHDPRDVYGEEKLSGVVS